MGKWVKALIFIVWFEGKKNCSELIEFILIVYTAFMVFANVTTVCIILMFVLSFYEWKLLKFLKKNEKLFDLERRIIHFIHIFIVLQFY